MTREQERLVESKNGKDWKKWGPYLSERQWGTVREDYSAAGHAWESLTHDMARSKAYRWGEDGIGGFSDDSQRICISWAFWNEKDPILKERLFGLTGVEGNHGEDVKELYYYLDGTPTHSYMKMLYKYPQAEFPYSKLVDVNRGMHKLEKEYEIEDTGIFDDDKYFDICMEYAKVDSEDILFKATIHNRSKETAPLLILPTIWFRNTWSSRRDKSKPAVKQTGDNRLNIRHDDVGNYSIYFEKRPDEFAFCNNETNRKRLYGTANTSKYVKDGIHRYVVEGKKTINSRNTGTKCSGLYWVNVQPGKPIEVNFRLSKKALKEPFRDYHHFFEKRKEEANQFYNKIQEKVSNEDHRNIQRQAFAGMLWSKQFYYYNVRNWLLGDEGKVAPPEGRRKGRNSTWQHLFNHDIVSMPDKWEYPWYAAWDLAFHCIPLARIDPDFAKEQLILFLKDRYMHPNGTSVMSTHQCMHGQY